MGAGRTIAILVVAIATASLADAKARLTETTPKADAVLQRGPDVLELKFSEPIGMAQVEIALTNASGDGVSLGEPEAQPRFGARVLRQINQPLYAGVYTVNWRAVAKDGERTNGSYRFTVQPLK